MFINTNDSLYIYIYIQREREREKVRLTDRQRDPFVMRTFFTTNGQSVLNPLMDPKWANFAALHKTI